MIENILKDLRYAVATGIVLAIILVLLIGNIGEYQGFSALWSWLLRWCHVVAGIMWIGLLYYFNFVQIPNMGNIPDEQKPAIGKVIAPAALWWFRWLQWLQLFLVLYWLMIRVLIRSNFIIRGLLGYWYRYVSWNNNVFKCMVGHLA